MTRDCNECCPDHPSPALPYYLAATAPITSYASDATFVIPWPPQNFLIVNESTTTAVFFSLDGNQDHGKLSAVGVGPLPAIKLRTRPRDDTQEVKIWCRGATATAAMYVIAER